MPIRGNLDRGRCASAKEQEFAFENRGQSGYLSKEGGYLSKEGGYLPKEGGYLAKEGM
jgi:hypothetical protein